MFLYIRYKEDLVGLVVDEAPCVKLDELVSVLSSEFTNSAVQILKTLLEDMAIVPTSIYHWKQNLGKKLQTLLVFGQGTGGWACSLACGAEYLRLTRSGL